MFSIKSIKDRIIPKGMEIKNEIIRPVSEKWVDGLIHTNDNLQIYFYCEEKFYDIEAYLYYFDESHNELGYEFDVPGVTIETEKEANISFILEVPKNYSYSKLVIKGRKQEKESLLKTIGIILLFIIIVSIIKSQ